MLKKYCPKKSKDILGNEDQRDKFKAWLINEKRQKKAFIIHGTPGIGKTLTAYLIGEEEGYTIIETNCSDSRTRGVIHNLRNAVRTASLFGEKKLFLFDEADGISAWIELGKLIDDAKHPIVLTANELYRIPKTIQGKCKTAKFYSPRRQDTMDFIKKISEIEDIPFNFNSVTDDVRQSILALYGSGDTYSIDTIFDDVKNVFSGLSDAKIDNNLLIWLMDNATRFMSGRRLYQFIYSLALADRTRRPEVLYDIEKNKSGKVTYPYYYRRIKILTGKKS